MAQDCRVRVLNSRNGYLPQLCSQSTKGLHNFKTRGGRLGIGVFSNMPLRHGRR